MGGAHLSLCGRGRIASKDAIRGFISTGEYRTPHPVPTSVLVTFSHKGRRNSLCAQIDSTKNPSALVNVFPANRTLGNFLDRRGRLNRRGWNVTPHRHRDGRDPVRKRQTQQREQQELFHDATPGDHVLSMRISPCCFVCIAAETRGAPGPTRQQRTSREP